MKWPNATHAFVGNLRDIISVGEPIRVRGADTLEIRNRVTELERPRERCIVTPGRRNSIYAAVAETAWVLAGRNDLDFLDTYIPSAKKYSDDGRTWRAGYGPRIRNWHGVDQLQRVADLLEEDVLSRRAVISIFDPAEDFVDSKDIPCNNWIHSLVRGNGLAMNVAIRSNDIWFGFSGINTFEWSVVQEILAFWAGVDVGPLTFFASSLHLYSRVHGDRPEEVLRRFSGITCYEAGIRSSPFKTSRADFDQVLREFFEIESELRSDPRPGEQGALRFSRFPDPLFRDFLGALWIFHGHRAWHQDDLMASLRRLPDDDITLAVYDYFAERGTTISPDSETQPLCSAFWPFARGTNVQVRAQPIVAAIRHLHREKSNAYGDSWKRRGEVLGVLANIARKIDRLEVLISGGRVDTLHETSLDTAVDLFVYAVKYITFLADLFQDVADAIALHSPPPWSDGFAGFEELLSRVEPLDLDTPASVAAAADKAVRAFNTLESAFDSVKPEVSPLARYERAQALADAALLLVFAISAVSANDAHAFIAQAHR